MQHPDTGLNIKHPLPFPHVILIIFLNFFLIRTSVHCSSFCISTSGCSAFSFDDKKGLCEVGRAWKLSPVGPELPQIQSKWISSMASGKPLDSGANQGRGGDIWASFRKSRILKGHKFYFSVLIKFFVN